jgi:hypothetical protein
MVYYPKFSNFPVFCIWSTFGVCGGYPIIGLVIGLITFIPYTIISTLFNTFIAVITFPHDVFYTYYTLLSTQRIGPNLKFVGTITLWIPMIVYPHAVFITSLIVGLAVGLFYPLGLTFCEHGYYFWKILYDVGVFCYDEMKYFYDFQMRSSFTYLKEWREPYNGEVYDIKFYRIPIGFIMACWGAIFNGIVITFIIIINSPFIFMKTMYELWNLYVHSGCEWGIICIVPFVLANIVLPIITVLAIIGACVASFIYGLSVAFSAYTDGFTAAYNKSIENVKTVHKWIIDYTGVSCAKCFNRDIEKQHCSPVIEPTIRS